MASARHFRQVCCCERQWVCLQNSGVGSAVRESGGVGFLAFRGFFAVEDIMEGTNHKNQRQKDAKGNDDAFIDISGYLFFPQYVDAHEN